MKGLVYRSLIAAAALAFLWSGFVGMPLAMLCIAAAAFIIVPVFK